jgi:pyruvate/2-oxoacid:ferredoxin oxidoreductase alpha subunit
VLGSLANQKDAPAVAGYVYGLGGRDLLPQHVIQVFADLTRVSEWGLGSQQLHFVGLRE